VGGGAKREEGGVGGARPNSCANWYATVMLTSLLPYRRCERHECDARVAAIFVLGTFGQYQPDQTQVKGQRLWAGERMAMRLGARGVLANVVAHKFPSEHKTVRVIAEN